MELRGGGVLMRSPPPLSASSSQKQQQQQQQAKAASSSSTSSMMVLPLSTSTVTLAVSSSASFSSSGGGERGGGASNNNKSRKEQLTERLSRSRRSRFFGGKDSNGTAGTEGGGGAGSSSSPPPPPMEPFSSSHPPPTDSGRTTGRSSAAPKLNPMNNAKGTTTTAAVLANPPMQPPSSSSPAERRIALARAHNHNKNKVNVLPGSSGSNGAPAAIVALAGGGVKKKTVDRDKVGASSSSSSSSSAPSSLGGTTTKTTTTTTAAPAGTTRTFGGGRAGRTITLGRERRVVTSEPETFAKEEELAGEKVLVDGTAAPPNAGSAASDNLPGTPDMRPHLCLGASPRSLSSSSSSHEAATATATTTTTSARTNGVLGVGGVLAPSLRCQPLPRPTQGDENDDEEEGVESIVLLQTGSSSSTTASSSDWKHRSNQGKGGGTGPRVGGALLAASLSSSSTSSASMPKELPPPTFGPARKGSSTWRGAGGGLAAAAPTSRQQHHQVVIPVQAPPAAISRPVTHLPKTTDNQQDSAADGAVTNRAVAALSIVETSTSLSSSSSLSPTTNTNNKKTSPKQLAAAIVSASSGSGSAADLHSLSRWRRNGGGANSTTKEEGTVPGSGTSSNPAHHVTATTKPTVVTATSNTPPPSKAAAAAAAVPLVHHWKPGHLTTKGSAPPTVSATTDVPSASDLEATRAASEPPTHPAAPPSPPRVNPWKQMSKVRSAAAPANSSSPAPMHNAAGSNPTVPTLSSAVPSRVADRWGTRSAPVKDKGLDMPSSFTHGSVGASMPTNLAGPHDSGSFEELLNEEKKEDADGYIDPTPVTAPSTRARFITSSNNGGGTARPSAQNIVASNARAVSPFVGGRPLHSTVPPGPSHLRTGRHSPVPSVSAGETAPKEIQVEAKAARPPVVGGAVIETPDKVSVSSMKARFASPTVASSSRGGTASKSPGPSKRFQRPPVRQSTVESPRSQSAMKHRAMGSPNPSNARSSSVGRFASPTLASQKRSGGSPCPSPRKGADNTERERVTGTSMAAKFSKPTVSKASFLQPTLSSTAKSSPRKDVTSDPLSPLPAATAVDSTQNEPHSTIETPEPVNVRSMQGIFSGNKGESKKPSSRGATASPFRNRSPLSPPVNDARSRARERSTDVATPNAPPLPLRSIGKSANHSLSPTPSWMKRSPLREDRDASLTAPRVSALSSLSMPALEEPVLTIVDAPKPGEFLPPHRPKSPRDRPSSIPRWKQLQAIDAIEPRNEISSMTLDSSAEMFAKEETRPPASPRSPMERPWNKDLESPRGWRQRLQASLTEKAAAQSPKGGESMMNPAAKSSLLQMAADSVHAIDFDRGIPIPELKKSSGSGSREYEDLSDGDGAIPTHLPAEFAESLELHLDSRSVQRDRVVQRNAIPIRSTGPAELESQSSSGIIFGDPSTYGAAGGDAEAKPPRVVDRARAIANWKGGLGAKPPAKSGSGEADADILDELLASESTQDEDRITRSREESDRVSRSREELPDDVLPNASLSSPMASSRRGDSAVLRFWNDTSREEFDGAQEWLHCDPDLHPANVDAPRPDSPSLRKRFISNNSYKARVEDIHLSSLSDWRRLNSPSSEQRGQAPPDMFPSDPFALETLAGLYEEPVKGVPPAAFDPFASASSRGGEAEYDDDGVDAFDSSHVMDFFHASIRVPPPSSPAPTTFSAPNFEPKVFEDPTEHDPRLLPPSSQDRLNSASSPEVVAAREGRRRSSWGLGGRKSRRTNAI